MLGDALKQLPIAAKHAEGMSLRYGVICLGIFGVFLRVFFVGRKFALIKIIYNLCKIINEEL